MLDTGVWCASVNSSTESQNGNLEGLLGRTGCRSGRLFSFLQEMVSRLSSPTVHIPVMMQEILEWSGLEVERRGPVSPFVWIDGTLGGGGHALSMLSRMRAGDLFVGIDRDPVAVERSEERLRSNRDWACRAKLIATSYRDIPRYIQDGDIELADGILLDLGLSSDQLADPARGFSFKLGGPLDLRFSEESGIPASQLLKVATEKEIADIIYQYGEERFSRRIARAIVARRLDDPVETAEQLYDLIHRVIPGKIHGRIDSATRTFQALRIAVNHELDHLEEALKWLPSCLKPNGRLLIISFHSLEDRMVKHAFRDHPQMEVLTRKPVLPSDREIAENPRARSAKLRVAARRTDA